MADPGVLVELGKLTLTISRKAADLLSGNGELGKFFREFGEAVDEDPAVPAEIKQDLSRLMSLMGTNPDFLQLAQELLDGDSSAPTRMRDRITEAVTRYDISDAARVVDAVVEDAHRAATRAKADDRDAAYLLTQRTIQAVQHVGQSVTSLRVVNLDDAPDWIQRALKDLSSLPAEFAELENRTRGWRDCKAVAALIDEEDDWGRLASSEAWLVLTRLAESWGDWPRAVEGWRRVAENAEDPAGALVQGAVAAGLAGDDQAREELLSDAERRAPSHPRLALERVEKTGSPAEVLKSLEAIHSPEAKIRCLIHCHRALNFLLLRDTDAAEAALASAREEDPKALQVAAIQVNVDLERFRDALLVNKGVDAEDLNELVKRALEVRERLLPMARYEEACRALMMAADSTSLAGRRDAVPELLSVATDDERRVGRGDHVLAEAALRALQPDAALAVLWPERAEDAERRRILGQALSLSKDPGERAAGIALLDGVVDEGGDDGTLAAATRLIRCIRDGSLEWGDAAEAALADDPEYRWLVRDAKALWLADNGRWPEAEARLLPDRADPVAREALLQVYWLGGQDDQGAELARTILEAGTQDHALRVKCSLALRRVADFSRVRAELASVARDPRAPEDVRQFALRVWFDHTDPEPPTARFEILELWKQIVPGDPNLAMAWNRMDARLRE